MSQSKQIKLLSLLLAIVIGLVSTIMLLGIQINFNLSESSVRFGAPLILVSLVVILFVYKLISKQKKTNLVLDHLKKKGKKTGPYLTIFFSFFDCMCLCGIISVLFSILSGIFGSLHNKMDFNWIGAWEYTLGRLSIVFAIYVLCFLIYTVGQMIAYAVENRSK